MIVGFCSPMPPAPTGVAEYAATLLKGLGRFAEVRLNPPDADVYLYHLGNNGQHREIYQQALERPGVAVLHDAVLHHFLLGTLSELEYVDEFTFNYGAWYRDLARELWRSRSRSGSDPRYFQYPMIRRVAAVSRALVVHNPGAAAIVRRHAPKALVYEIPHLWNPPGVPDPEEIRRFRASLGLGPSALVFGVFGYLRETKRLPSVLRAYQSVRQKLAGARETALVVAGGFTSSDLERSLQQSLQAEGVLRFPHTPESEFWRLSASVNVCINLRYPGAGETSGISIRLMGLGKPVIVTAGEETSRFPPDACLRVEPGTTEVPLLEDYMEWLARFPGDAAELGLRAANYIRETHALESVARQYYDCLAEVCHASR